MLSIFNKIKEKKNRADSPLWMYIWVCISSLLVKARPHSSHLYGFSPVCKRTCILRARDVVNAKEQTSHTYGLSPVCMRMWVFKPLRRVKSLAHNRHLYFSPSLMKRSFTCSRARNVNIAEKGKVPGALVLPPMCESTCFWKLPNHVNSRSHSSHLYGLLLLWMSRWRWRSLGRVNDITQKLHWNGFSLPGFSDSSMAEVESRVGDWKGSSKNEVCRECRDEESSEGGNNIGVRG